MAEIKDLLTTITKYRDAVIIIGDKVTEGSNLLKIDENTKKIFNRKNMVKNPKTFWTYYKENIYNHEQKITEGEKAINKLLEKGVAKMAINMNYTNNIKVPTPFKTEVVELKGDMNTCNCMSCGKKIAYTKDMLSTSVILKCECGGKISPTITMFGEKYKEKLINKIKDAIFEEKGQDVTLKTHILMFIGVDFEEDYLHELMESYSAIKTKMTTEEEPFYTVMITDKDGVSIEYYQPEFATYENIAESIERLLKML